MQILVLGMHRSGTSMVARLLNMMGVYFAPEGVSTGANAENPKGFWERRDVRDLNDMLLRTAKADWDRVASFAIPGVPSQSVANFRKEAKKIILGMDAHRPWFLKEPRLCILAPFWLELLEIPVCLFVYRSPLEVARSLAMRNGFGFAFSLALWERYSSAALNATRRYPRIQVNHADLITDPVGTVRQLQQKLEVLEVHGLRAPSYQEIRAFIDLSLYRAKGKQFRARLSPAQRKLRDAFERGTVLLSKGIIHFSAESHEILKEHDRWMESLETLREESQNFSNLLAEQKKTIERHEAQLREQREKVAALQSAIEGRDRHIQEQREKIRDLHSAVEGGNRHIQEQREKIRDVQSAVERRDRHIQEQRDKIRDLQRALEGRDRHIQEQRAIQKQLTESEDRRRKDLAKLGRWSDRLTQDLSRLLKSKRWRLGCWLSLKPAGEKSKEAQRFAQLVASRPRSAKIASERVPDQACSGTRKSDVATEAPPESNKPREPISQPFIPPSAVSGTPSTKAAPVFFETCQLPPVRLKDIERAKLFSRRKWSPAVDIVIPIHNASEDVRCCLESLVQNTKGNYSIIAVDDGSDVALQQYLEAFSTVHPRCRIIHNDTPKGYTGAANQGLKASSGDYVILLNSDTIVASGWLEALVECGQSDPRIGILGPLSNAASFQSVPERRTLEGDWAVNSLPVGFSVEDMSRLVNRLSKREFPRVPFVNGFCYVIKRSVIETIGYLDEETFPDGYGEENDYSLRARDAGFVLAVADQAFVFHSKSKSFGHERRREISRAGWEALKQKHGSHRLAEDLPCLEANPGLTEIAGRIQDAISSGAFVGLLNETDSTDEAPVAPMTTAHLRPCALSDTSFGDEDYQRFLECCTKHEPAGETGAVSVAAVILVMEKESAAGVSDTIRSLQRPNRNTEIHVLATRPEWITLDAKQGATITIHQADPSAPGKSIGAIADVTTADFLIVLYGGDQLGQQAFAHLDEIAKQPTAYREHLGALVFDDDVLDQRGHRTRPRLKPGWSPSRLLEDDYIGNAIWLNRAAVRQVGGFSSEHRFYFLPDLLLRLDEAGYLIDKQDVIDLHRSASGTDVVDLGEQERLIRTRTTRVGGNLAHVEHRAHFAQPRYSPGNALVSVIVPFRDHVDLLSQCVGSILAKTTFPSYELLLVNNQSAESETETYLRSLATQRGVRIIHYDKPFNYSRINNFAAQHAIGNILIFLNNDTEVISVDWMDELAGDASQPGIGAVGAMLYFADGTIQHGGIVIGLNGLAGHLFAGVSDIEVPPVYLHVRREVSAVTGACLAIRKEVFQEVGGFNERFRVTGNDVEFGLRLRDYGYRNIMNPRARLFHYEKSSRSHIPVEDVDIELSLSYYQPYLDGGDPYFNRNLSRNVTYPTLATRETPRHVTFREQYHARCDSAMAVRALALRPPARSNRTWNLPDHEVIAYDVSSHILRENYSVMQRFYRFPYLDLNHVLWFVPHFDHLYRGGIFTIFRAAAYFSQRAGTRNTIILYGERKSSRDQIASELRQAFPALRFELREYSPKQGTNYLPESDAAFCTLWTSAYHLVRYNKCKAKFSFLQDYEPVFYPAGSVFGLTEETYRFGFIGVANTPGVAEVYRRYTPWVRYFVPAVDQSIYRPRPHDEDSGRPLRIVFYGRPNRPRNAFRLGVEALRRVKELYGDRVEIVSVGADFAPADYGLRGVIENRGVLGKIEEVADLYRNSDIGLVFMFSAHPSYQPFEFMASGCVTITNDNPLNHWLLRDGENAILATPTVSCVTEKIVEAMEDHELRVRIIEGGLATVRRLDWAQAMETMYQYVRHPYIVQRNGLLTGGEVS